MFRVFLFLLLLVRPVVGLNYFWLSMDPVESASWYCDQHCFKIGSEVIESVWDVVLILCVELSAEADLLGFGKANRYKRHSRPDTLWHPLSVWHGMCRANLLRGLVNANAIFAEHFSRTGTRHKAWDECLFLMKNIKRINFQSEKWKEWWDEQSCKNPPKKTKPIDSEKRKKWAAEYSFITKLNRNTHPTFTEPPQCISQDDPIFSRCRVPGDVVRAYRSYYNAKLYKLGFMRYYYSNPPKWLFGVLETQGTKKKMLPYDRDENGYVVVEYS